MRTILAALALLAFPAVAQSLPQVAPGTSYAIARQQLRAQGWQPVRLPGADACMPLDARCRDRAEMFACAGTGVAACVFTWTKDGVVAAVLTRGEESPTVTGVRPHR